MWSLVKTEPASVSSVRTLGKKVSASNYLAMRVRMSSLQESPICFKAVS
jgi:hypothetical protein